MAALVEEDDVVVPRQPVGNLSPTLSIAGYAMQ